MNAYMFLSRILHEQEQTVDLTGLADKKKFTESDADPKELEMGLEVEKEHSLDPEVTKQIALDHLTEIPDYYTRLKKMEDEAKKKS